MGDPVSFIHFTKHEEDEKEGAGRCLEIFFPGFPFQCFVCTTSIAVILLHICGCRPLL